MGSEKTLNVSEKVHKEMMTRKYKKGYETVDKVLRDMIQKSGGFEDEK